MQELIAASRVLNELLAITQQQQQQQQR